MGIFTLGIHNYQVNEAIKIGKVKLSRWQRFIGFFNENSIWQVRDLQQKLSACKTYQEHANLCSESVRNPEIRNSLSLHLAGSIQSAINLHFDFNGQSHLIHEDFIMPTNDDNQGFTFDKKNIRYCRPSKTVVEYADSIPKLYNGEMDDIKFKLETGEKLTLNNYFRDPKIQRDTHHRSQDRIESYHQLQATIAQAYGTKQLTGLAIEVSNQCGRLIANAIIYFNSAILSKLHDKYETAKNIKILEILKKPHQYPSVIFIFWEILSSPILKLLILIR